MDAKQLFLERYRGFQEYPALLVEGMSEEELRRSPHARVNPIVWILWHTARCEDMAVHRLLTDGRQVLDEGSWAARLGASPRHMGTGMTKLEVDELCRRLEVPGLLDYRRAVAAGTEAVLAKLAPGELSQALARERLHQVLVIEGAGGAVAERIVTAYLGHTKGWLLGHLALTHNYYHIGQAFAVRAMHGRANPG